MRLDSLYKSLDGWGRAAFREVAVIRQILGQNATE